MTKIKRIFLLGLAPLLLWACKGDITGLFPEAGGKMGELVLVVNEEDLKSEWVDTLQAYFTRPMPVLPQDEPYWKLYTISPSSFQNLYRVHRNILIISINPRQTEAAYAVEKDGYATGQLVVTLAAKDKASVLAYFKEVREEIETMFRKRDMEKLVREYDKIVNREAQNKMKAVTGLRLSIPDGFFGVRDTTNFVYYSHEATRQAKTDRESYPAKIQRGIWVASGPYLSADVFKPAVALHMRDSITALYIPSSKEGSFMMTEPRVPSDTAIVNFNGQRALIQRGLWRMKDEFKGGPYVNILTYNPQNARWVMIDGFVYAPQFDKRDYMLQVESIVRMARP